MRRSLSVLENLIRVKRYAGVPLIKEESVSDHIWSMITIAIEFIPILNEKTGMNVPLDKVVFGITMHDLDESLYTDIPREFKHYDSTIEKVINDTADSIMRSRLSPDTYKVVRSAYEDAPLVIHYIIKLIDIAQAGYKMKSEIELGNNYFVTEINNAIECLKEYKSIIENDPELTGTGYVPMTAKNGLIWLCNEFISEFEN